MARKKEVKGSDAAEQTDAPVEEQKDSIESILSRKANKQRHYGSRSGEEIQWPEKISTGSVIFDAILDGGYRCGWSRFMSKAPEAGKTSMGISWAKNWQDKFGKDAMVVYFNAEGRITRDILEVAGIDTDKNRFRIIDTNSGDFVFDIIDELVKNNDGKRYFFMIDSTDALVRDGDKDKGFSDAEKMAGGAVLTSSAGKRLTLPISVKGHHLFICSQERAKMGHNATGTDASGGQAPRFYSSLIGEIQPMYASASFNSYINEQPSNVDSKKLGHFQKILLKKTPNQKTGEVVAIPIKYGHKGGVWTAYEAMMICQMWDWITGTVWMEFDAEFYEELKTAGVDVPNKFHGGRALRDAFDFNEDLVTYVINKFKGLNNL